MTIQAKEYAGGAAATTLSSTITNASTAISGVDLSTYPTGSTAPFVICLDRGTATEEKILCASRATNTLTVTTRGYDGTTAAAHTSGATLEHVLDAVSLTDANKGAVNGVGRITTIGDTLYADTTTTMARLPKGAAWQVYAMNDGDTIPAYASGYPGFVFTNSTARDAAIVTPIKGMAAWLTGTGTIARTVYDGTAWRVWEVWGTGSPESSITATVGAMYHRTDGGASTSLYVKESGTGNTGWIAYGGGGTYPAMSGFSGYNSAGQSIPASTSTALLFDTEDFDQGSYHSTVSNTSRMVAPATGYYIAGGGAQMNGLGASKRVYAEVAVNGTAKKGRGATGTGDGFPGPFVSLPVSLTANDYVEILLTQTDTGAVSTIANESFGWLVRIA